MEDIFVIIFAGFAAVGMTATMLDLRHFDTIVKECKEQGYVQDDTTRVLCVVQKKEAK